MTDNEIIKALEELKKEQEDGYITALEFGGKRDETHEGFLALLGATLDLINRQKAEIERLLTENHSLAIVQEGFKDMYKIVQSNAIKEFAENAKEELYEWVGADNSIPFSRIKKVIDNLVKEMVGDGDG